MQQQLPQLLTVKETARLLRQSPWSVRQKIARGQIPAVRVGTGPRAPIRVDSAELERFIYGEP